MEYALESELSVKPFTRSIEFSFSKLCIGQGLFSFSNQILWPADMALKRPILSTCWHKLLYSLFLIQLNATGGACFQPFPCILILPFNSTSNGQMHPAENSSEKPISIELSLNQAS